MTDPLLVSTLIAPPGMIVSEAHIQKVAAQITQSGGKIVTTKRFKAKRAADIFHKCGRALEKDAFFDIITQPAETRRKKILIADMESTIIEQEMLDELAASIGIGEKVATITHRAMNGELDFPTALKERARLLKGQPESLLSEVSGAMTLMSGAQDLVVAMKREGGKCWLVSGGFTFFVRIIAERLGFDQFYGNQLGVENGFITGEVALPILGKETKRELLEKACMTYGCSLVDTLVIGDGANDVPMLEACNAGGGLGIAYHAKPKVREIIHNQINQSDLSALVYAQNLVA